MVLLKLMGWIDSNTPGKLVQLVMTKSL